MDGITPTTPTVRAAHARLAALHRHRPGDGAALLVARRELAIARAAALTAAATRLLRSGGSAS
jgi:hypothetical protein